MTLSRQVTREPGSLTGDAVRSPTIPDASFPSFVLGQADMRGDKRALIEASTGRELTYPELAASVREVAGGLAAQGVAAGDVLAMCTPNSIELIVAFYAALSLGASVTVSNPESTRDEIVRELVESGARWLVTTVELFEHKLQAAARETRIIET
ncbi:MAG TPA: AMP-binding protein, partial [Solirubrobacteraceae bacterium]